MGRWRNNTTWSKFKFTVPNAISLRSRVFSMVKDNAGKWERLRPENSLLGSAETGSVDGCLEPNANVTGIGS